jgi:hypothetical protein
MQWLVADTVVVVVAAAAAAAARSSRAAVLYRHKPCSFVANQRLIETLLSQVIYTNVFLLRQKRTHLAV